MDNFRLALFALACGAVVALVTYPLFCITATLS
jgi:hypothetical protein